MIKASLNRVKISPDKANLVTRMVRGMNAGDACDVLKFTRKRIAADIRKLIISGIDNAQRVGVGIGGLYIKELYVGKSVVLRRMHCRARGRGNIIRKPYSNIYLVLDQK
jgi:large subunit ribosomal protein L22